MARSMRCCRRWRAALQRPNPVAALAVPPCGGDGSIGTTQDHLEAVLDDTPLGSIDERLERPGKRMPAERVQSRTKERLPVSRKKVVRCLPLPRGDLLDLHHGQVLGVPGGIPPEQAREDHLAIVILEGEPGTIDLVGGHPAPLPA